MSKELEALYNLDHWIQVEFADQFKVIEKALKDYEQLKIVAKPLTDEEKKSINNVAKRLQALEIIKENIGLKMSIDEDTACLYVPLGNKEICIVGYVKGKEKIDLLKEVLK